jgi:hypothetical protein
MGRRDLSTMPLLQADPIMEEATNLEQSLQDC